MPNRKNREEMPDSTKFTDDRDPVDTALGENADARAEAESRSSLPGHGAMRGQAMPPYETVDYVEETDSAAPSPTTATSRELYIERMKANLEERGIAIHALAARAEGLEPTTRSQYLEQIANLQALQDRATKMLHSLSETGESAWHSMAEGVDVAYEGLRSALDSVVSRFRPER